MSRRSIDAERVQLPEIVGGVWSGKWLPPVSIESLPKTMTLDQLRNASRYWIRDVERDLKPRTIKQIYAENRAGRTVTGAYRPRTDTGNLEAEYLAWCKAKKHKPHPASIDPEHPVAQQRLGLRYVHKETV